MSDEIKQVVEAAVEIGAIVNVDGTDVTPEQTAALVQGLTEVAAHPEELSAEEADAPENQIDAVAEHVKGSFSFEDLVEAVAPEAKELTVDEAIEILANDKDLDFGGIDFTAKDLAELEAAVTGKTVSGKNRFDTQDLCPMKHRCNHVSAEHCKQAKLEHDHRRQCTKPICDCFSAKRGIPNSFRFGV